MSNKVTYSIDELTVGSIKNLAGVLTINVNDEYAVMDITKSFDILTVASATSTIANVAGTGLNSFPLTNDIMPFNADLRAVNITLTASHAVSALNFQVLQGTSVLASIPFASGIIGNYITFGIDSIQVSVGGLINAKISNSSAAIACGARIDAIFRKR